MSRRSYRYSGYYIEVAVQKVGEKHFEGTATIFGSPGSARSGQGPVHRCARMGHTREEADGEAGGSPESGAECRGKRAGRGWSTRPRARPAPRGGARRGTRRSGRRGGVEEVARERVGAAGVEETRMTYTHYWSV